jgi:hypothetical protein
MTSANRQIHGGLITRRFLCPKSRAKADGRQDHLPAIQYARPTIKPHTGDFKQFAIKQVKNAA